MAEHDTQEVNVYTNRKLRRIQPLMDAYTHETGIKVNLVLITDDVVEYMKAEGDQSPADVLITVDIGRLLDLVDSGVTQPIKSRILESVIPANLRDVNGQWYALSLRDRVLYAEKHLELSSFHYEDLADPKYKGKVCIRSGQHPYNTALVAAMIAHNGTELTEQWLRGVKANLAREATGDEHDVARDIFSGVCDIGLANALHAARLKNAERGTEARKWGSVIKVIRPTFADKKNSGTHVNISGAVVAKHAPHKKNAIKLLEFLVSKPAQSIYAQANYEYPVRAGVKLDPIVARFGPLKADPLPLTEIARYRKLASTLLDKVGFDN